MKTASRAVSAFTFGDYFAAFKGKSVLATYATAGWWLLSYLGAFTLLRIWILFQMWSGPRIAGLPLLDSVTKEAATVWGEYSFYLGLLPVIATLLFLMQWGTTSTVIARKISPKNPDRRSPPAWWIQFKIFVGIGLVSTAASLVVYVL